MTKDYREGYQDGFKDGFKAGQDSVNVSRPISIKPATIPDQYRYTENTVCPECGMEWKGPMGYSCGNLNCPVQPKVTSHRYTTTTIPL